MDKQMDCRHDSKEEGYFFRRKRMRMTDGGEFTASSKYVHKRSYRRKNLIMYMPIEILLMILSYISNECLASNVRLVSRKFRVAAECILNDNFKKLKSRIENLKKMICQSLQHAQDDMETRCMCKLLNTLEVLGFYHSLITSTLWRYIYFQAPSVNLCMYAGSLLDDFDEVLRQFITEPNRIYSPGVLRDYALSKEVKAICNKAKMFVLYFDHISEMPLNKDSCCTGSKIVDILDSATDCARTVITQSLTRNNVALKLRYRFTNAWFVALDVPEEKPKTWNEEQRLMYMRIRRIVIGHSEMTMEYNQFKREVMLRSIPNWGMRRPINSVYTGYGKVGSKFFYYGVMNEGAYFSKFEAEIEQRLQQNQTAISFLGLNISVELRCPLKLAPYAVIEEYRKDNYEALERCVLDPRRRFKGIFDMKVDFECTSAQRSRLPTYYRYYLMIKR